MKGEGGRTWVERREGGQEEGRKWVVGGRKEMGEAEDKSRENL